MAEEGEDRGTGEETRDRNPKEDGRQRENAERNVNRERSGMDGKNRRKRDGTRTEEDDHGNGEEPQGSAGETRTGKCEGPSDGESCGGPNNEEMDAKDAGSGEQKTDGEQSGTDKNHDRTPGFWPTFEYMYELCQSLSQIRKVFSQ